MTRSEFKAFFNRMVIPAKLIGLALLTAHVALSPTEKFSAGAYVKYLAVVAGLALLWMAASAAWFRLARTRGMPDMESEMDDRAETSLRDMCGELRKRPWHVLLIPGEDGLFFLPLLYLGVTPLTSLAAAALFAASHLCCKPLYACAGTFVMSFLLCLAVLPSGILAFAAGHLTVDLVIFLFLFLGRR